MLPRLSPIRLVSIVSLALAVTCRPIGSETGPAFLNDDPTQTSPLILSDSSIIRPNDLTSCSSVGGKEPPPCCFLDSEVVTIIQGCPSSQEFQNELQTDGQSPSNRLDDLLDLIRSPDDNLQEILLDDPPGSPSTDSPDDSSSISDDELMTFDGKISPGTLFFGRRAALKHALEPFRTKA